ncbi:nucleotidyltransferase domain-containing protein [Haloarchaeobius sp. TZWWS8]|uniref:nucleotidyltransferase domain-containing protein n=1 Tax=Haloarchaeobius sp. TZWWS8 TaxID=3446121 RepID=UPI003EB86D76
MTVVLPGLDDALAEVESTHDFTVLAARDLGSRAWGLDDDGSDYDVAFLFRQPAAEYATLRGYVETVETSYPPALELTGWNLTRFAELLVESNPTALEFLHTPVRYREFEPLAALETDVADEFERMRLYHHYRSLAERQFRKYLQRRLLADGEPAYVVVDETADEWLCRPTDEPVSPSRTAESLVRVSKGDDRFAAGACDQTVKRTLYVVRAVLIARYVRDTHRFPTLDFPSFLDELDAVELVDASIIRRTRDLVARKRAGEGDEVVGQVFTEAELTLPKTIPPAEHAVGGIPVARVDSFVRDALEKSSMGRGSSA